jgi:hypothetical protein
MEQAVATSESLRYNETRWDAKPPDRLLRAMLANFLPIASIVVNTVVHLAFKLVFLLVVLLAVWTFDENRRKAFERVGLTPADRMRLRDFIVQREGAAPKAVATVAGDEHAKDLLQGTRSRAPGARPLRKPCTRTAPTGKSLHRPRRN